jgi:hypothetical protein
LREPAIWRSSPLISSLASAINLFYMKIGFEDSSLPAGRQGFEGSRVLISTPFT